MSLEKERYEQAVFPITKNHNVEHETLEFGIDKMEYFCAAALTGLLASGKYGYIADTAVDVCDLAMLVAKTMCDGLDL